MVEGGKGSILPGSGLGGLQEGGFDEEWATGTTGGGRGGRGGRPGRKGKGGARVPREGEREGRGRGKGKGRKGVWIIVDPSSVISNPFIVHGSKV